MFVLTKSCISSTSSFCSFAPSIERSHPESDMKMAWSVLELDCMIVVVENTSTVLYSCRVANFVADRHCKMEDTLAPYSS